MSNSVMDTVCRAGKMSGRLRLWNALSQKSCLVHSASGRRRQECPFHGAYKQITQRTEFWSRSTGSAEWHVYSDTAYSFDCWSNIHYGYVGSAVGFERYVLLDGAGAAQFISDLKKQNSWPKGSGVSWLPRRWDRPEDRAAIALGVKLYVALHGVSYLAICQWHAAAAAPPHLAAIVPWEGASDSYRDVMFHGGVPETAFVRGWSRNMAGPTPTRPLPVARVDRVRAGVAELSMMVHRIAEHIAARPYDSHLLLPGVPV